jgi:hypothetical protein
VSLLEQSIDNDDESADQTIIKQPRDMKTTYSKNNTTNNKKNRTRMALHTAIDVEMTTGKNI